jgi:hypothetical protein
MRATLLLAVIFAVCSFLATPAAAHPGGKDKNGCHTNRKTGEYHCHGKEAPKNYLLKKRCKSFQRCQGCGCKGGPGYRSRASGKCVSHKRLQKECGNPPSPMNCVFENQVNTNENKECYLGK